MTRYQMTHTRTNKLTAALLLVFLVVGVQSFLVDATAAESPTTVGNYIAVMKEQIDVGPMAKISDLNQRRWAIYRALKDSAERSQAGLVSFLQQEQVGGRVSRVNSLWNVNAVAFTGQARVAQAVAARPDVLSVSVDEVIQLPNTDVSTNHPDYWNLDQIKAKEAWAQGYSGAGSTRPVWVGSIDTGVDVTHPGLGRQFRGTHAPGQFDAHYNWKDFIAENYAPVDPNGHGTHVMGAILGGDGPGAGTEDTGVAYNARWISARAFDETGNSLSSTVLLATQWMQAPTTMFSVDGQPLTGRPDLAPDLVNNSWSTTGGCRLWWKIVVDRWVAANIVPMFSVGDEADAEAGSVNSPADLRSSEGVGATDLGGSGSDVRAGFSSRGPASCDVDNPPTLELVKPDVTAPGVAIRSTRSASKGGGYSYKDGTSMSTAQASGVVALMLDAAGQQRSVTATLTDLNNSADRPWINQSPDLICEPSEKNNDLGCGRINALRAVNLARRSGSLNGYVRDSGGVPIEGARVSVVPDQDRTAPAKVAVTNAAGFYSIPHLKGQYEVTVRAWGFISLSTPNGCTTCTVSIPDNQTISRDYALQTAPRVTVTGTVRRYASQDPAGAGIRVKILDAPPCTPSACYETNTDANGGYVLYQVPVNSPGETYDASSSGDRCAFPHTQAITVSQTSGPIDIVRPLRRDGFGYFCVEQAAPWIPAQDRVDMHGDDVAAPISIPFAFPFYTGSYSTAHISSNGFLRFGDDSLEYMNGAIPSKARPNNAIYPFWDDLSMSPSSKILTRSSKDSLTVEWRDMTFFSDLDQTVTFSVTLHSNGDIEFKYRQPSGLSARGASATTGIENFYGDDGFQYSFNEAVLSGGTEILWSRAVAPGVLKGIVSGPGGPISLAEVNVRIDSARIRAKLTNPDGSYRHWLNGSQEGTPYEVTASAFGHEAKTVSAPVTVGSAKILDFSLVGVPASKVSGVVTDSTGLPVAGIPVTIGHPNIPDVRSDATGYYEFSRVPAGTYTISTGGSRRCRIGTPWTGQISGTGPVVVNLTANHKTDGYGYICNDDNQIQWETGLLPVVLTGDENIAGVGMQFAFPFYESAAQSLVLGTNGVIGLAGNSNPSGNTVLASDFSPNFAMFPFWDDLKVDQASQVLTKSEPSKFVVEYRNVLINSGSTPRITFQVILKDSGAFQFQYKDVEIRDLGKGSSATIGIEDGSGRISFPYSFNEAAVSPGLRIEFSASVRGILGRVTDASKDLPLAGTRITISDGVRSTDTFSAADGVYRMALAAGTYSVTAAKFGFTTQRSTGIVVPAQGTGRKDFALVPAPLRTVQGKTFDTSGKMLPGTSIEVTHVDSGTVAGTVLSKAYGLNLATYGAVLPEGTYDFRYPGEGYCMSGFQRPPAVRLTIPAPASSYNLAFPIRRDDGYGFTCRERPTFKSRGVRQAPVIPGNDGNFAVVTLPFEFPIYGEGATTAYVSPNGWLQFDRGPAVDLKELTRITDIDGIGVQGVPGPRNGARIDVFNTISPAVGASIFFGPADVCFPAGCSGTNPDPAPREFVIEWRDLRLSTSEIVSFAVVLKSDGSFEAQYQGGVSALSSGRQATIQVKDPCGRSTFTYFKPSFDPDISGKLGPIKPNTGIWFFPPFVNDVDPTYVNCPS